MAIDDLTAAEGIVIDGGAAFGKADEGDIAKEDGGAAGAEERDGGKGGGCVGKIAAEIHLNGDCLSGRAGR